jgi:hypothetical protein
VEKMKKLMVKDRKLAKKLEDRLIKKGLVVALCEREENSYLLKKAKVVIQIKNV